MNIFTVVIPTIWNSDKILHLIENISKSEYIGEIIIIDNNPNDFSEIKNTKVKVVHFPTNQFVNKSWNYAISIAKFDYICLLNDNLLIDIDIFEYISKNITNQLIGIDKSCYNGEKSDFFLEKTNIRNKGFGCIMFFPKSNYIPIPDDLKIWFGDDWLIKNNLDNVYRIHGLNIDKSHFGNSSSLEEFKDIVQEDIQNSVKYDLPWSSDF